MRRVILKKTIFINLYLFIIIPFFLSGVESEFKQEFVRGELIVKPLAIKETGGILKKNSMNTHIIKDKYADKIISIEKIHNSSLLKFKLKKLNSLSDYIKLINDLSNETDIEDISLNYIASISDTDNLEKIPDDPGLRFQYALNNTGELFDPDNEDNARIGSDIRAFGGWYWAVGEKEVIIAIVDTGVALRQEDLKDKIVSGYNFVADNNNPYDDHGHGTFVASIAAAKSNNGIGMAGVAWNSLIMPVKVMDGEGNGSYIQIAAGIRYAADNGARVINISVGGVNPSFILEDACKYAYDKGCVIVAASGNTSSAVLYPAAYDDYCLAVGATDYRDELAYFSNYGSSIDIVAPGVDVFGAVYNPNEPNKLNTYGWDSGTSFSAPFVSGGAAVLLSYKPSLSVDNVRTLIMITADDVNYNTNPGIDMYMGYGRLNLTRLLSPYKLEK